MRRLGRAALAMGLAAFLAGCGAGKAATTRPAPCPDPPPDASGAAAVFYVQPAPGCASAVDWTGHPAGAVVQLPRCVEACAAPSAPPDGSILMQGGWSWPARAIVPLGAAGTLWSPDSRYQCGFMSVFAGGGTLAWKTPLGAVRSASLRLPSPTGRLQVDACDPAQGFAVIADQYGLYTRLLAVVRLPDGRVLRRWSYPGPGPNAGSGASAGVTAIVSLDGRVVAETPVSDDRAAGDPVLRSTESGQVLARLPRGLVLALNAPGTLVLLAAPETTALEAVTAPWQKPVSLAVGGRFEGAYPDPQGGRLAVAASHGGVVIVTANGRIVATLAGVSLLAP